MANATPSRKVWIYALVAVGLLLVVIVAFRGAIRSILPTWDFGTTSDMTPVRVWVSDERSGDRLALELPKAYLRIRRNWDGGEQTGIWAEFGVRSQEPRAAHPELLLAPGDPVYDAFNRAWRDQLQVNVRSSRIDARRLVDSIRSSADYVLQSPEVHGLEQYRRRIACAEGGGAKCTDASESYFLPPAAGAAGALRIRCSHEGRPDPAPQVNCTGDMPFRGWHVTYFFRATELARWKEFHVSAVSFLEKSVRAHG